jgi:RimJ/RimL family protein N-acetyltransferase
MSNLSPVSFVSYDEDFLRLSWQWLNDPEIKQLTNSIDFTQQQQLDWFHSLPAKKNYLIYGVEFNGMKIGVVGLKNIDHISGEYWGYIGDKSFWGRGIGAQMVKYVADLARSKGLVKIYLFVNKDNHRAIRLYEKLGFLLDVTQSVKQNQLYYYFNL